MTKLEEEIKAAISEVLKNPKRTYVKDFSLSGVSAKAAAEVAKKYIEKAFEAGYKRRGWEEGITGEYPDLDQWLKENGIE